MTDHHLDEGLLRKLATLPTPAQHPVRREVVRVRYLAALERRQRARDRRAAARRRWEPIVVGGFSLIYLLSVVYDVWKWR